MITNSSNHKDADLGEHTIGIYRIHPESQQDIRTIQNRARREVGLPCSARRWQKKKLFNEVVKTTSIKPHGTGLQTRMGYHGGPKHG